MRLKRLYIGDFGIFRNQIFEELAREMVVIGGLNRAGKTTLLNVLRYLGYGYPKSPALPLPVTKYQVQCDFVLDSEEMVNLCIDGYGEPSFHFMDEQNDNSLYHKIPYKKIDLFTYSRLFTISMDQLKKVSSNKDGERLLSVLLGAGLSDIIHIPLIEEALLKEAEGLGGKRGSPKVKSFKSYYQAIIEGMKERDEALEQVNLYNKKKEELTQLNREIEDGKEQLNEVRDKLVRLDVLKTNYEDYERFRQIGILLDNSDTQNLLNQYKDIPIASVQAMFDKYFRVLQDYEEQLLTFSKEVCDGEVSKEDIEDAKQAILKHSEDISFHYQRLPGLKEKIKNHLIGHKDYQEEKDNILAEMDGINEEWDREIGYLMEIQCDALKMDEVLCTVEDNIETGEKLKELDLELMEKDNVKREVDTQLSTLTAQSPAKSLKLYFCLSIFFTIVGIATSTAFLWQGIMIMVGGITGAALYVLIRYLLNNSLRKRIQDLMIERDTLEKGIEGIISKSAELNHIFSSSKQKIDFYRNILKLPESASPTFIKEYFRAIQSLKVRIKRWLALGARLKENDENIEEDLRKIGHVIQRCSTCVDMRLLKGKSFIDQHGEIISKLEEIHKHLQIAEELHAVEMSRNELEMSIRDCLESHDDGRSMTIIFHDFAVKSKEYTHINDMLSEYKLLKGRILQVLKTENTQYAFLRGTMNIEGKVEGNERGLLQAFNRLFEEYPSLESVHEAYLDCKYQLKKIENTLDELKSKNENIKMALQELATTDKLYKSGEKINNSRAQLRPLAEKYGILMGASFILGEVRRRFMENAKSLLLDNAGKILEQITSEDYKGILPGHNLAEADFQSIERSGAIKGSTDMLSRGTKEQLFLAVRLGRIMEVKPPLPVIIDDSLANFDNIHMENTIDVLKKLSKTHQIFMLTCHPSVVKCIKDKSLNAQFWKLEQGIVSPSSSQHLIAHLKN